MKVFVLYVRKRTEWRVELEESQADVAIFERRPFAMKNSAPTIRRSSPQTRHAFRVGHLFNQREVARGITGVSNVINEMKVKK